MESSKKDKPPVFSDFVKIGEVLTVDQAIEKLVSFHKLDPENILNEFVSLSDGKEGNTVVFKNSMSKKMASCFSMEVFNKNGNLIGDYLIDKDTGQPT